MEQEWEDKRREGNGRQMVDRETEMIERSDKGEGGSGLTRAEKEVAKKLGEKSEEELEEESEEEPEKGSEVGSEVEGGVCGWEAQLGVLRSRGGTKRV